MDNQLKTVLEFITDITAVAKDIERDKLLKLSKKSLSKSSSSLALTRKRASIIKSTSYDKVLIEENITQLVQENALVIPNSQTNEKEVKPSFLLSYSNNLN